MFDISFFPSLKLPRRLVPLHQQQSNSFWTLCYSKTERSSQRKIPSHFSFWATNKRNQNDAGPPQSIKFDVTTLQRGFFSLIKLALYFYKTMTHQTSLYTTYMKQPRTGRHGIILGNEKNKDVAHVRVGEQHLKNRIFLTEMSKSPSQIVDQRLYKCFT